MRRLAPLNLAAALILAAALLPAGLATAEEAPPDVRTMIDRSRVDGEALASFYGVPLSPARRERLTAFHREVEAELGRVGAAFEALSPDARVDYVLLKEHTRHALSDLAFQREREKEMLDLLPFADDLVALEEARRRLDGIEPRAAAGVLAAAKSELDAVRKRLKPKNTEAEDALKPEKHVAMRAARAVDGVKRACREWFDYRNGFEPDFGWWTREPYRELDEALGGYAKFLRETVAGVKGEDAPLIGDPIGRDALLEALRHEMISYTPEELVAIAEKQFAWCENEAARVSQALGFEGDWKKVVEHVKGLHAAPGEMDDVVARQAREAIAFLDERGLVTIPPLCRELWRLEMLSTKAQKTLPFAAYTGNKMAVAFATEDMTHEAKLMSMRGNNRHFSRLVTPHELIPGHHLQMFMAARHSTHRRQFRTPFLVEGWALYWEMRLWELDWPRGPEDRVGMLFWRMHRCARIIVSLGFHLGEMSPQEMIDFLVDRVGLERDGATSEVRRYISSSYGPLYQCAYMIGGLQLRALHRELVEAGRMSEREFHDAVLRQNAIPIEMIRARLSGTSPRADHQPVWRFAGEVGK